MNVYFENTHFEIAMLVQLVLETNNFLIKEKVANIILTLFFLTKNRRTCNFYNF